MLGKHGAAIRASAPASSPGQPALDHQMRVSGTVAYPIGRKMGVFLWHPLGQTAVRFVAVSISIDNKIGCHIVSLNDCKRLGASYHTISALTNDARSRFHVIHSLQPQRVVFLLSI